MVRRGIVSLPRRSFFLFAAYLAAILVMVSWLLYPKIQEYHEIGKKIDLLKLRISRQQQLFPLYNVLGGKLRQLETHPVAKSPGRTAGDGCLLRRVTGEVESHVIESGLRLLSITPEAEDLLDTNLKEIRLYVDAAGPFPRISDFLERLVALPCISRFAQITIQQNPKPGEDELFHMRLWVHRNPDNPEEGS